MNWEKIFDKLKKKDNKSGKLLGVIWPILSFVIGLILGIFLSPQVFFMSHTGILAFSDFEHTDFKNYFQSNFRIDSSYDYLNNRNLIASVRSSWVQQNHVSTRLEVPDFVKVTCVVKEPEVTGDDCNRYIIPSGSIKQLLFNITIGQTHKTDHQFCLVTEEIREDKWWTGINDRRTCIDVTINS